MLLASNIAQSTEIFYTPGYKKCADFLQFATEFNSLHNVHTNEATRGRIRKQPMKQNEDLKQKLARALRANAQPMKNQTAYAGADIAIRTFYNEMLEQIYGAERLYGEDTGGEYHPYFNNRNARDPFNEHR